MHFTRMIARIFLVGGLLMQRRANNLPLKKGKKAYRRGEWPFAPTPAFCLLAVGLGSFLSPVSAQIIPDATLPGEGSRIIESVQIQGTLGDRIEGGALRGTNLFHSFQEFNVVGGQRVYFANPAGIENILSRVTGNNGSDILGTLGVLGEANLFFVNPNGIFFGPDTQLDVRGSFVASTGNGFNFPDGSSFSATNPEAPPLLTINVTPGIQWGTNPPQAEIVNEGNLAVGQDLTLAGTRLNLSGQLQAGRDLSLLATDTVQIRDSANNPFIASAGGELLVQGNQAVDIFALNHPDSGLFSGRDLVLRSANTVIGDAHYWSGGTFQIEQLDSNPGSWLSPNDPVIRANGDVSFDSYQGASLHIFAGGSVNVAGDITITGADAINGIEETVTLSDGTTWEIDGRNVPTLDIRAGTTAVVTPVGLTGNPSPINLTDTNTPSSADITIDGTISNNEGLVFLTNQFQPNNAVGNITVNNIYVELEENNVGNAGSIIIDSRGNFTPKGIMDASTFGQGDGGEISIQTSGAVELDGKSVIFNNVAEGGVGNAGNISIKADSLSLTHGALVSRTSGQGDGGEISIQTSGAVELDGNSLIFNNVAEGGVGNAGNISIKADSLSLTNDAKLSSRTSGQGDGGEISIQTSGAVELDGNSLIFNNVAEGGVGNAGNISIKADSLSLTNDAKLSSRTSGQGDGGEISIQASGAVELDGNSVMFNDVAEGEVGNAGLISIKADSLSLTNGAALSSRTSGQGDGGEISIQASGAVELDGNSVMFNDVAEGGVGNAGLISIKADSLSLINGAILSSGTSGQGDGGEISIQASGAVELDGNSVMFNDVAEGEVGNAGLISIKADSLSLTNGAALSSRTSGQGDGGEISIQASGAVELDGNSVMFNDVAEGGVGNAGLISIKADSLSLINGAILSSGTSGQGDGGEISIQASGAVELDGNSLIFNDVAEGGVGNAGLISIKADSLSLTNDAQLSSGTSGQGDGGEISIQASGAVELDGNSLIFNDVEEGGVGNAGLISIKADSLSLTHGAALSSRTSGQGDGGEISIQASGAVELDGNSFIFNNVEAGGEGNAGLISIKADSLSITNGAQVQSLVRQAQNGQSAGQGNGGRVDIEVQEAVTIEC